MKKRQIDVIADILEEHGFIDNFYAIETKLTYRPGARIHDLRARGWEIETREMPNKNTYYRLVTRRKGKRCSATLGYCRRFRASVAGPSATASIRRYISVASRSRGVSAGR